MIKSKAYPITAGTHLAIIRNPKIFESTNTSNYMKPTERIRALAMNFRLELLNSNRESTGQLVSGGVSLASRHGRRAPLMRLAYAARCLIDPDDFHESEFEDAIVKVEVELCTPPHMGLIAIPKKYSRA